MKIVDNIYLINLETRKDRLQRSINEFNKIGYGQSFQRWNAIPGDGLIIESPNLSIGWNKNAMGLLYTTIEIIEDAKSNLYDSIMIVEDDILFKDNFDIIYNEINNLPYYWESLFLGSLDIEKATHNIGDNLVRLKSAMYCHCYILRSNCYDFYLKELKKYDQPIDWITGYKLHKRGRSFAIRPNIAIQYPDYSNIRNKFVEHLLK